MTNENLKVDEVLKYLGITYSNMAKEQYPSSDDCENVYAAINLIKSQKFRIELLESAIREFLEISKTHYPDDLAYILSKQTLEILMGNE